MENDVKEDLEQARPKLEPEKQKQELEEQKQEKQDKQEQKPKQEKEESKSKEQEEEIKKQKRYSYIFWGCLIVLFVVYFSVKFFAYSEPNQEAKADKPKKLFKYAEKFLPTDIIKDNLNNHQAEINAALNSGIEEMNGVINTQIDGFFDIVEYNVDKFLDWHYSVKGDYSELALFVAKKTGLSAEDTVANVLQEKLLGKDYKQRLDAMTKRLSKTYASLLNQHEKFVSETALKGVDTDLSQNAKILDTLGDEVARKLKANFTGSIGATAGVSGLAIAAKLTPKLVAKIGAKLGAKVGGKFLAKIGTALSGSWTCGPFAPACVIGIWFGSDVVINFTDEWIHRDGFKKEILNNINEVKENLKNSYKQQFNDSFVKFSQELQEDLKNIETISVKVHVEKLKQTPEEDNQKIN
ncbi:hypothetical protein RGC45_01250 [Helicobacter pylori]|uniref:hypothetical protein n=1 Tax=Helicobacter pylori TaxID=210 RepID=UPI00292A1F49|nr:hypothetical protein [Helicobacter pylori]MDU9727725.1 hypothetical protein [Helicobacter pylori]